MVYEIQKNVPIPAPMAGGATNATKYGWEKMEVGDSIFVPESEVPAGKDLAALRYRITQSARKYGDPLGRKFDARIVEESRPNPHFGEPIATGSEPDLPTILVKGVRTWRIDDKPKTAQKGSPAE